MSTEAIPAAETPLLPMNNTMKGWASVPLRVTPA
jgi:hypothetical protein